MKTERRLVIEDATEVSGLHCELEEVLNYFIEHTQEEWVKAEFPHLIKLKNALTSMVVSEPGDRVYEKMVTVVKKEKGMPLKSRLLHLAYPPPKKRDD